MGSSTRVLHVDDEPGFNTLLESVFNKETPDGTVITAASAEETLEQLESTEVDCIVSDYDMPNKNGLELLTDVRERYPELPFILFTGKGSESIASEAITAGVTDYLQKGSGKEHYELLVNRITHAVNQYRAQQELRDTKEYFSTILSHTSDYIMIVDDSGVVSYVSPVIERMMGFSPEEIIGMNAFELVHPDDMDPAAETFSRVVSNPAEEFVEEFRAKDKDGSWVWLEVRGKNLIEDTMIDGILVDARDITKRKKYEDNLAILTESLPELFLSETQPKILDMGLDIAAEIAPAAEFVIYLVEADEQLVPVSASGSSENSMPTISLSSAGVLEEAMDTSNTTRMDLRKKLDSTLASELPIDQGFGIPIEDRGVVLVSSNGTSSVTDEQLSLLELMSTTLASALNYLDWKNRVESREEMVTAQNKRLEEFTSIVSHDLRNPLNIAQGRLELAREEVTHEHLDAVDEAHSRMITLIDDLLALAKHGDAVIEPEPVDLERIAQLAWTEVGDTDVELIIEESVTELEADSTQLRQLFINLFQNAIEHGEEMNTITVGQLPTGFFVEDNGTGIPADERDKVFRAGYSTTSDGTGFGLRIVESVANAHNWDVSVKNGSDGGARFEIATE